MSALPQISICIPTFNRCERLRQVLAILLSSEFPNFEIVVSDDASPDATWETLQRFDDSRVRAARQERNLGMKGNWNAVVRMARAPLILRLDDDDYIAPQFLGRMVDLFQRHPEVQSAYTGYAYTRGYDFFPEFEVVDRGVFADSSIVEGHELIRRYLLQNPFPGIHPSSVVFRAEAGAEAGWYRDDFNDHTFALALAACGRVGYVPEVLFFYVQHNEPRVFNAGNSEVLSQICSYDPLDAWKTVYESSFNRLRELPEIQDIKDAVRQKHLRLYPCIQFYTVRNNYRRHSFVVRSFYWMAQRYPRIARDPMVWSALLVMLLPMSVVRQVMRWYRNRAG